MLFCRFHHTLSHSPLSFTDFKKFLLKGTEEEYNSEDEDADQNAVNGQSVDDAEVGDKINDEAVKADSTTEETQQNKTESPEPKPVSTKLVAAEPPPEDESAKARRRKSMLWGYMNKKNEEVCFKVSFFLLSCCNDKHPRGQSRHTAMSSYSKYASRAR